MKPRREAGWNLRHNRRASRKTHSISESATQQVIEAERGIACLSSCVLRLSWCASARARSISALDCFVPKLGLYNELVGQLRVLNFTRGY